MSFSWLRGKFSFKLFAEHLGDVLAFRELPRHLLNKLFRPLPLLLRRLCGPEGRSPALEEAVSVGEELKSRPTCSSRSYSKSLVHRIPSWCGRIHAYEHFQSTVNRHLRIRSSLTDEHTQDKKHMTHASEMSLN